MKIASLTAIVTLIVTGCGGGTSNTAMAQERRDDRRDRKVEAMSGWEKLGERWIDGKVDRDVIDVGAREGRFTRVMLKVEHSALELYDIKFTFGDGSEFSPPTRLVFDKNDNSRTVDLPGGARVIRRIEFKAGNLPGGGKAQLEVWAK